MKIRPSQIRFFLVLLAALFVSSCASFKSHDLKTPEGLYADGKEAADAGRYEYALNRFSEIRNKFPYSPLATEAELAVADTNYAQESYAESQLAYQNFRDLHPKHPKIDYVIYRTAMSYYNQLPETNDRDLTLANDAIYHFEELVKKFPMSQYTAEARQKKEELYSRLMQKELYIADFYFKQEKFGAALFRYEAALSKYPGFGFDPRAHYGALLSAQKTDDSKKQKYHAQALLVKFPASEEAKRVKQEGLDK